jgi:hypothetical protein
VRGQLFRLSRALWELGATPGILVRGLGPWGPQLIQKYARNRCASPNQELLLFSVFLCLLLRRPASFPEEHSQILQGVLEVLLT